MVMEQQHSHLQQIVALAEQVQRMTMETQQLQEAAASDSAHEQDRRHEQTLRTAVGRGGT